jgi:choline monooxygenase
VERKQLNNEKTIEEILALYDPEAPLSEAWTIPASWYLDSRIADLERRTVFAGSWQAVGRVDQVAAPGQYLTAEVAGEPVVVVRGRDSELRGFFNVCRHHAAAVMTEPEGRAEMLRCPYHGWSYSLDGQLRGTPDFAGVCNFDPAANGLMPVRTESWEQWVFVKIEPGGPTLTEFLGPDLMEQVGALGLGGLHFFERRHYELECNWKVFIDNYLDGGYHVPHLHRGLASVLDYSGYTIENGERFCLQSSPIVSRGAEPETGAVRQGDRARYYWIYPNFMINWYRGLMDTNLVIPRGGERTEVIFDFYFSDLSGTARAQNLASLAVSERIQSEDVAICRSVQRGLHSRAYQAGRLSIRREAGERLFHQLLWRHLKGSSI